MGRVKEKTLKISEKDKLRVYYGHDDEDKHKYSLVVSWPVMKLGIADGNWIFSNVFTQEVRDELEKRGWDLTTLKFSIAPKLVNPTRPERFTTLLTKYADEIEKLKEND
jgi:hypothetical protein